MSNYIADPDYGENFSWYVERMDVGEDVDKGATQLYDKIQEVGIERWAKECLRRLRFEAKRHFTYFDPDDLVEIKDKPPDYLREDFPEKYVYCFWNEDALLYIGQTARGLKRIREHLTSESGLLLCIGLRSNEQILHYNITLNILPLEFGRMELESWLIKNLKPYIKLVNKGKYKRLSDGKLVDPSSPDENTPKQE